MGSALSCVRSGREYVLDRPRLTVWFFGSTYEPLDLDPLLKLLRRIDSGTKLLFVCSVLWYVLPVNLEPPEVRGVNLREYDAASATADTRTTIDTVIPIPATNRFIFLHLSCISSNTPLFLLYYNTFPDGFVPDLAFYRRASQLVPPKTCPK
jgi:hypothetical protein